LDDIIFNYSEGKRRVRSHSARRTSMRIRVTVGMELTGSTLVNKNMSCGKYANNSGSDVAARTSGGERGALFLSTHSLRPRGVGGDIEVAAVWIAPKIRNTYCTAAVPLVDSAYIHIYYTRIAYNILQRRTPPRNIKAPETSSAHAAALPRATNSIHGDRHETFLSEIQ